MEIIEQYEEQIPCHALCYLLNNDASGLSDNDIKEIDAFMAPLYAKGHIIIDCPGGNEYFTRLPAFGLACTCEDCTITIHE